MNRLYFILIPLIFFLLISCSLGGDKSVATTESFIIPEHIKGLENLSVFSFKDEQQVDTVELIRETVFESNSEVYIEGYTGEVAVDDNNRVYIVGSLPGTVAIYVFNPDGSYITKFMNEGRGPGEVEAIGSMQIYNNKLYALGPRLQKFVVYSLDDYSLLYDAVLKRDSLNKNYMKLLRASKIFVADTNKIFLSFKNNSPKDSLKRIYYLPVSVEGQILPDTLFTQKRYNYYEHNLGAEGGPPFIVSWAMPFNKSSQVALLGNNIVDVWTEDFFLKIRDRDGKYNKGIYYPHAAISLEVSKLNISEQRMKIIEGKEVPEKWPVIHRTLADNNQIWIATITESDSTFNWWVLDEEGKLKASFTFKGEKENRSPGFGPDLPIIRNGYFYERERSIEDGYDRIVKYKIVFRPE